VLICLVIAGIVCIGLLVYFLAEQEDGQGDTQEQTTIDEQQQEEQPQETQIDTTGLIVEDIEEGNGQELILGDVIRVHYDGTLEDDTVFDSSRERGEPFELQIGVGQVIQGWDLGLEGMKVGGKRKLTIPPQLAYGETGVPGIIPPNTTLYFEIELLQIVEIKG